MSLLSLKQRDLRLRIDNTPPGEAKQRLKRVLRRPVPGDVVTGMSPFEGERRPLLNHIRPKEVESSMKKLNNGRSCGYDSMPAELLKYAADVLAQPIADIFKQALEEQQPLSIGRGVLILLQKSGKPRGPLSSLRPIVLLTALRKTLSLVALNRIYEKVDAEGHLRTF